MIRRTLDLNSIEDYRLFLKIKGLPAYRFQGREAMIPDEYAHLLGEVADSAPVAEYRSLAGLWDYQEAIAAMAIRKRKFAVFADCGTGKTMMMLEFARHANAQIGTSRRVLIVSPLMVIKQTIGEARKFYGDGLPVEQIKAAQLGEWLDSGGESVGITNYDSLHEGIPQGRLGCLILDESSMLKSLYGKWGAECIRLGRGLDWKLALTGTPAPNDRIEYANHSVFLDVHPTVNSFLARYFVNRGQTDNRWEMKPHALRPFYQSLSHWCIFLTNPATYGWKDNTAPLPPIHVHIHDIDLTSEQNTAAQEGSGMLFAGCQPGGIVGRSKMARIAKGRGTDGAEISTHKPAFIRGLVDSWPDESTLIWCRFNDEQKLMERTFPGAASIAGGTPQAKREELIADFQARRNKVMISKAKLLGFGLNLQVATRHIFSSLHDSFEDFYQCVKRSNRYGSNRDLNVHVPLTELERPMVETVLRKAARIEHDAREQEEIFRDVSTA